MASVIFFKISSASRLAARRDLEKMTEMPSKRRSENRPFQDLTDTRDTRETIGLYIYIYIYIFRWGDMRENDHQQRQESFLCAGF